MDSMESVDFNRCRQVFLTWLNQYSDNPDTPNTAPEFLLAGLDEFHRQFQEGKLTATELGHIIDMLVCW